MSGCSLNSQCVPELFYSDGSGITEVPVLCRTDPLTLRCRAADREGAQCGVQAVDSIVEMLSKENVVFHRLTGQSVQLLPPAKTNFLLVFWTVLCIVTASVHYFLNTKHTWGNEGPRQTGPHLPL